MKKVTGVFTATVLAAMISGCSSTSPAPSVPSFRQQLQSCERFNSIEMQLSCIRALNASSYGDRVEKSYQLAHKSALNPATRLDFANYGKQLSDLMRTRQLHQWPRTELHFETTALLAARLHGDVYNSYGTATAKVDAGCHPLRNTSFAKDNSQLVKDYAAASCWAYLSDADAKNYISQINEMLDLVSFVLARGGAVTLPSVNTEQRAALPYALFIAR